MSGRSDDLPITVWGIGLYFCILCEKNIHFLLENVKKFLCIY